MGKQIEIIIDSSKILINSDVPSFDELVKLVLEHPKYNYDEMIIKCSDDNFDISAFKKALIDVIESTLKHLTLENEKLDALLGEIENKKTNIDK